MNLRAMLGLRPNNPPGATYFVDTMIGALVTTYVVRMALPGEASDVNCKAIGPMFTSSEEACKYRAWLDGSGPEYRYPDGPV